MKLLELPLKENKRLSKIGKNSRKKLLKIMRELELLKKELEKLRQQRKKPKKKVRLL